MQFSDYSFQIIPRQVFHPDNCSDHPLISTFLMSNCGGPGQNPTHFRTKERELKHEVLFGSRGLSIVLQFSFFHSSNSEVVKDLPSYWYSSISFPVQPWLLGSGVLSDRTPRGEEAWMSKPLKDQLSYNRPSNHRLRTWSCFSSSYKVLSLIDLLPAAYLNSQIILRVSSVRIKYRVCMTLKHLEIPVEHSLFIQGNARCWG